MDQAQQNEYEDFWQRPSALQKIELARQYQKQRDAKAWQRNMVGAMIFAVLVAGCCYFLR